MATNNTPTSSTGIATFSVDELVELHGLENSPHLNRRVGYITGGMLDNGRYPVVLCGPGKRHVVCSPIALKPGNLKLFTGGVFGTLECHGCGNCFTGTTVCGNCKVVNYCSQECQQDDWPKHKDECKLFKQGRTARKDETKLPKDPGERIRVRITRARRWAEKGKHANAEAEYKAIVQELPVGHPLQTFVNTRIRVMMVDSILEQNKRPEKEKDAVAILRQVVSWPNLAPEDREFLPQAYGRLGKVLLGIQDFDGAEQAFKAVLELEDGRRGPETPIHRELQRIKQAKKDFSKKEKKKSSKGKKGRRK